MKKNAFTLIEIVIVIAIIGIMALVSVPAFNQYEKSNQFDTKVEEITALFNRAYALSQSPVRSRGDGTAENTCDRVDVLYKGNEFKIVLKKIIDGVVSRCDNNPSDIVDTVNINESGSLPMQIVGLPNPSVWTFKSTSVSIPTTAMNFILATTGSDWVKQTAFNLSKTNNNFSIKNGQ